MEEILYNRCFGRITKLNKIAENKYIDNYGMVIDLEKSAIIGKTSPNIIDLIEVGDYVNRERIHAITDKHLLTERNENILDKHKSIITILTKEQYDENCYCEV